MQYVAKTATIIVQYVWLPALPGRRPVDMPPRRFAEMGSIVYAVDGCPDSATAVVAV